MRNAIAFVAAASAPLLASATLQTAQSGGAMIVNQCSYDIPMKNIPAMGQGVENGEECDKVLAANGAGDASSYFTPWTVLNVAGGWSMKLNTLGNWNNIMQYEYTWTGDKEVWYDMSFVNGVPSDHPDWHFVTPGRAAMKNAYTFATDDAAGMQQPVPVAQTVTLILCPGNTGAAAPTAPATSSSSSTTTTTSSPAPAPTTTSTTTEAPKSAAPSTTLATSAAYNNAGKNVQNTPSVVATPSSSSSAQEYDIVTEYATQVVTAVVTETAHAKAKRHEHRHPHGHKF